MFFNFIEYIWHVTSRKFEVYVVVVCYLLISIVAIFVTFYYSTILLSLAIILCASSLCLTYYLWQVWAFQQHQFWSPSPLVTTISLCFFSSLTFQIPQRSGSSTCLSFSDLPHLASCPQGPFMLPHVQDSPYSWLHNIPWFTYATSSLSIHLLIAFD